MERPVPKRTKVVRLGAELLPVLLIMAGMAGTLALVLVMYRSQVPARRSPPPSIVSLAVRPATSSAPITPSPPPPPPPPAAEPAEDLTPGLLAPLEARKAEQADAAARADRKAKALVEALRAPREDSARRRRRAMLVRAQVKALDERANLLETEAEVLDLERDVLGRERDAAKAALAQAKARGGYALLPYRGPNGTWRRPIAIECRDGMAVLEPNGPALSLLELATLRGVRSNPLVAEILHLAAKFEGTTAPDGSPVVPYVLFVVRPDGIRPFYEARGRLEPLGIAYGYELIDQDWEIEYPDLDDPLVWDSVASPRAGLAHAPADRAGAGGPDPVGSLTTPGRSPVRSDGVGVGQGSSLRDPGRGLADSTSVTRRSTHSHPAFTAPGSLSGIRPGPGGAIVPPVSRSPSGDGSPTSGTRVEIVPRGREGFFDLDPDPAPERRLPALPDRGDAAGRPKPSGSAGGLAAAGRGAPVDAQKAAGIRRGSGNLPDLEPVPGSGGSGGGRPGLPPRGERPLDLDIACGPKGVTIHPGGYRLTVAVLNAEDGRLAETLRTIVRARSTAEPGARWRPGLRFLVEPGGQGTYWTARRQTLLSGLDWPVSLRVAEADAVRTFKWERW